VGTCRCRHRALFSHAAVVKRKGQREGRWKNEARVLGVAVRAPSYTSQKRCWTIGFNPTARKLCRVGTAVWAGRSVCGVLPCAAQCVRPRAPAGRRVMRPSGAEKTSAHMGAGAFWPLHSFSYLTVLCCFINFQRQFLGIFGLFLCLILSKFFLNK
jgi:hypothetical protein